MTATLEPDAGSLAPGSGTRRSRTSRLSTGHLLIALAAAVAVVANYAVLRAQDDSVRVAVVATDVAAGDVVEGRALTFADVRADDPVLATLLTPADLARMEGHVATTTLRAGELLRRGDLQPAAAPAGQRAMSVAIGPERAVGGKLAPGDHVDVIEVRDGEAAYLIMDARVLDVPDTDARAGLGAIGSFSVTLAVDDETALRLALAQHHGDLHLVRSTGATPGSVEQFRAPEQPGHEAGGTAEPESGP